ncbi:hypothetical protein EBF03_08125 [Arcanobacterium haemolyticum]|uniref:hypothetical protein n=1 Tax=Arcanobacterium haemolyticum TaxID=28264 RepID=UPI0011101E5D|nr:hypothetical protein [Arcanobacterium haemolyticum]QCX47365.1 hypothetical protein EBF03_08125 [Arcanobacterium haemolyticum]
MNKFKDDFKRSLDSATNDKESRVEKASYDLLNVLDNINQDELSTTQFDTFTSIVAQLKKAREDFDNGYTKTCAEVDEGVRSLKKQNRQRKIAELTLLIIGLYAFVIHYALALVLMGAALAIRHFGKNIYLKDLSN